LAKRNETKKLKKLPGQIKLNLAGSINARSSIKHLHLVPFVQQIWLPRAIFFYDWLMLKKSDLFNSSQSETRIALGSHICWPNGMKRRNFIEDLT
jgi:hypothetical protein